MIDNGPTMWDTLVGKEPGWLFVEFPEFTSVWKSYFLDDPDYAAFQSALAVAPESGDLMPGCGGLRKVRWAEARRNKGKRGGLRIVYQVVPAVRVIVLVDVYDKNEADDLSAAEKKTLSRLARAVERELIDRMKKRGPE